MSKLYYYTKRTAWTLGSNSNKQSVTNNTIYVFIYQMFESNMILHLILFILFYFLLNHDYT